MTMPRRPPPFFGNGTLIRCACEDGKDLVPLEVLVRDDYERARREDTWADLMVRARFSKEDRGLLIQWMQVAEVRAADLAVSEGRATAAE